MSAPSAPKFVAGIAVVGLLQHYMAPNADIERGMVHGKLRGFCHGTAARHFGYLCVSDSLVFSVVISPLIFFTFGGAR